MIYLFVHSFLYLFDYQENFIQHCIPGFEKILKLKEILFVFSQPSWVESGTLYGCRKDSVSHKKSMEDIEKLHVHKILASK